MNILERLPMKITESNSKRLKQEKVQLNYINNGAVSFAQTNIINNEHITYGDFTVDEPINMIDSNGVILTNIKGIIDNTIFKQCVKCNRVKEMSKFGFRVTDGKRRDQPRCNKCR